MAQRLEGTLQHQQEEVQGLLEQMRELKQHCEGDRDIQKQVLEDQRKRAEQSVNTAAQLSAQLLDKVQYRRTMLNVLQGFIKFLLTLMVYKVLIDVIILQTSFILRLCAGPYIFTSLHWSHILKFFLKTDFLELARVTHAVQTLTDVFLSSLQEAQLAEALSNAEMLQQRYSKQNREKSKLELEITTLHKLVTLFVHLPLVFTEAQPCLHIYNLLFLVWIMF